MLISRTGDVVTVVAISWLVLDIAGPVELGLVVLCQGLPRIVAGPVAGRLLDRVPPRLLLGWDNAVRGVLIGLVPVLWSLGGLSVTVLCVLSAGAAVVSVLTEVAEGAVVPRLVPVSELDAANTALATNWEAAAVLGPPLAGALVAAATAPVALVADAASFFVMSALCFALPVIAPAPADGTRPGFGAILRLPVVFWTSVATCGFLFLGGMTEVRYPVLSREVLHTGPVGYGLLVGAAGAGGLAGVVVGVPLVTRLPPNWRVPAIVLAGTAPFASLTTTAALVPAVVLVAVAGACWGTVLRGRAHLGAAPDPGGGPRQRHGSPDGDLRARLPGRQRGDGHAERELRPRARRGGGGRGLPAGGGNGGRGRAGRSGRSPGRRHSVPTVNSSVPSTVSSASFSWSAVPGPAVKMSSDWPSSGSSRSWQ
jgi:hypothetical protein